MRQDTTIWKLLTWSYRNQMVQYETDRHWEFRLSRQDRSILDDLAGGEDADPEIEDDGRGCINGAGTTAHADAHIVHAHVSDLRSVVRQLIVSSAAKGTPPDWNPALPASRVVPSWMGQRGHIERKSPALWDVVVRGKIRMHYGVTRKGKKSHEPNGCMIEYEGISDEEAARIRSDARRAYSEWWLALSNLSIRLRMEPRLRLWTVTEIGVQQRPWATLLTKPGKSKMLTSNFDMA